MHTITLTHYIDPTLTKENLSRALRDVPDSKWRDIAQRFHFPISEQHQLQSKYLNDNRRKKAVIENYVSSHPCPTWVHVSRVLQSMEFHKLAYEMSQEYLQGKLSLAVCNRFVC